MINRVKKVPLNKENIYIKKTEKKVTVRIIPTFTSL